MFFSMLVLPILLLCIAVIHIWDGVEPCICHSFEDARLLKPFDDDIRLVAHDLMDSHHPSGVDGLDVRCTKVDAGDNLVYGEPCLLPVSHLLGIPLAELGLHFLLVDVVYCGVKGLKEVCTCSGMKTHMKPRSLSLSRNSLVRWARYTSKMRSGFVPSGVWSLSLVFST